MRIAESSADADRQRRPTLVEVAKLAGVSHMTVSRYLNGTANVKAESRERIDQAILELDYRPNMVARSLRKPQRGLLAIVVPATDNAYNPTNILSSAGAAAHVRGYEVEVVMVEGNVSARSRRVLELSASGLVEGVVSLARLDDGIDARVRQGDAPVVVFEVYDDERRGAGILLDATPITLFVEHLAALGHRRLAYITGPAGYPASVARERAYLEAVGRLKLESYGVLGHSWSPESALIAVTDIPDDAAVTAIVCANDELAAGAIRAALDRGWDVPGTVSVTGWDDFVLGAYLPPGLTTVHVAHDLLGQHAIAKLVARLRNEPLPADPDPNEGLNTLVWRASVGVPGGAGGTPTSPLHQSSS
jgi:DNA-binding LacI/PurR family transcriptional regulator